MGVSWTGFCRLRFLDLGSVDYFASENPLLWGSYAVHCMIFSSISDLYPLDASSNPHTETQLWHQICLQTLPNVWCRPKLPTVGNHCLDNRMFFILGKQTNLASDSSVLLTSTSLTNSIAPHTHLCLISPPLAIFSSATISYLFPLIFDNGPLFIRPTCELTFPFESDFFFLGKTYFKRS